jgi:hypothetical protein
MDGRKKKLKFCLLIYRRYVAGDRVSFFFLFFLRISPKFVFSIFFYLFLVFYLYVSWSILFFFPGDPVFFSLLGPI